MPVWNFWKQVNDENAPSNISVKADRFYDAREYASMLLGGMDYLKDSTGTEIVDGYGVYLPDAEIKWFGHSVGSGHHLKKMVRRKTATGKWSKWSKI